MTSYTITANDVPMGSYKGATRDEAILAYVRDAGYASVADAAEALSQTEEEFLADIVVTEGGCGLTITLEHGTDAAAESAVAAMCERLALYDADFGNRPWRIMRGEFLSVDCDDAPTLAAQVYRSVCEIVDGPR